MIGLPAVGLAFYALHRLVVDYWFGSYENDFRNYYDAASRLLGGGALYAAGEGFIYPPPAVLLFVPLTFLSCHAAYVVFSALTFLFLAGAMALLVHWFRAEGQPISARAAALIAVLSVALAPTFENAAWGQVNTLVLWCGVGYFWLMQRRRFLAAGLCLALGVWLKLYPALLLWCMLLPRNAAEVAAWRPFRNVLIGFIAGLVLVPLLLLPWLPWETYREYVFQVMPSVSGIAKVRIMNQSVVGAFSRWPLGAVDTLVNIRVPLAGWIDWTNKALFGVFLLGLTLWCRRGAGRAFRGQVLLMAGIPVFAPFGWCYVYVLVFPLAMLALVSADTWLMKGLAAAGCLGLTVPVHHILPGVHHLPMLVQHALYSRYLPATALLAAVVMVTAPPRREGTA